MSILIVRRGIQGPRGLSGLAARESLLIAANMEIITTVADNIDIIAAAPVNAENITYDNSTSDLAALSAQDAIDELAADNSTNSSAIDLIQAAIAIMLPVGSIITYAGPGAPTGYLQCYGQAISRTTYAALFTAIGVTHGAGDGSTTFNVPDIRGRSAVGQDNMGGTSANRLTGLTGGIDGDVLGATGGAESHVLTTPQIPSHTHPEGLYNTTSFARASSYNAASPTVSGEGAAIVTGSTGGGLAHNNVQPSLVLNYLIKHS